MKKGGQVLRCAEHSRKKRWHRKQLQHFFFKDPFKAAKGVIIPKVKNEPKVPKSVLDEYIQKVASDQDRTVHHEELNGLDDISLNIGKFDSEKFKISELSQVVKRREMSLSWALTKYGTRFIRNALEL